MKYIARVSVVSAKETLSPYDQFWHLGTKYIPIDTQHINNHEGYGWMSAIKSKYQVDNWGAFIDVYPAQDNPESSRVFTFEVDGKIELEDIGRMFGLIENAAISLMGAK